MCDPNQLTALNLSFQPMSVPLTMICVVKWLWRRKSPESKRLSACLSLSNEFNDAIINVSEDDLSNNLCYVFILQLSSLIMVNTVQLDQ